MEKLFYNARDIVEILGICYANALALIKHPDMKAIKINKGYYVEISKFNDFMSNHTEINLEY